MREDNFKEIVNFLSQYLFKECYDLLKFNMPQIHSLINLLVNANIPFVLTFTEGSASTVKYISIAITISPTTTITKEFQLEEGTTPS